MDSSVKRNTGFIKKLRQLSDENAKSLMDELAKLNQSRVGILREPLLCISVGLQEAWRFDKHFMYAVCDRDC